MGTRLPSEFVWIPENATVSTAVAHRVAIHPRLRRDTAALHEVMDRGLGFLLGPELSMARYRQVLAVFHGFHAPLEVQLARLGAVTPALGVALPARALLLERDLRALGLSTSQVEELPSCKALPALARAAHLAGALYVVEGACLGGRIISRAVERQLGVGVEHGASFFVGDGARTGPRWKRVLAWLDELVADGSSEDDIVAGARQTFAAFSAWLREQGVSQ